ncbi:unnamed protein product [Rotaria socialis]|uniref:GH16 domain-containing protein n=1 Tax=Rotaria socialis TaxID=392032 RepID=A0A817VDL6_9BILA|nr:unnamed protein product [Rotaria socialis]
MSNNEYHLVWEDSFSHDGPVDRNKWDFDTGTGGNDWGNQEAQYYTDRIENARYQGQRLIIEARREDYGGQRFTSARLKSKSAWTYGRLQAKAKLPSGRGLWPAIWMLPQAQSYGNAYWPDNGEIDLMEQVGFDSNRIVSSVHTAAFNHMKNSQPTNGVQVHDACNNFKIYTLDWTSDKLEMFVGDDNNPFFQRVLIWERKGQNWEGWPFDKNFFILLNIAVGGSWGGQKGIDEGIFPKTMEIEWIRFYQCTSKAPVIDPPHSTTRVIGIRSSANGKFICAENGGNSPLIANRDTVSGWETFDLIILDGNNVALKSHANGQYVCAENSGDGPLIANRSQVSSWESFTLVNRGDGRVALVAVNEKYVCADNFGNSELVANRTSVESWETFDLVPQ